MDLQTALNNLAATWNTKEPETIDGLAAACPVCGTHASFSGASKSNLAAHVLLTSAAQRGTPRMLLQLKCAACHGLAVVASQYLPDATKQNALVLTLLWPRSTRPSKAPPELPDTIRRSYDEARLITQDSPMAAAVLARRCLQQVIRERLGINRRRLQDEIEEAITRDELTRPTRESLDHVRTIGNWAAHPVEDAAATIIEVTHEEADYTLDVLEMLFQDLYTTPAIAAAMSKRLASRKS